MTVRQIAYFASVLLQADDLAEVFAPNAADGTPLSDADTMVKCVNMAAAEVNTEFPALSSVTAESEGGLIPPSVLGGVPDSVRSVTRGGKPAEFGWDERGVRVRSDGTYEVRYTLPYEDASLDQPVRTGAEVSAEMLAYLSARNYCLITGRTDEASIWDVRYTEEKQNKRLLRRARLPKRAFIL